MRLDEWQRYIHAQFLDDEDEPATPQSKTNHLAEKTETSFPPVPEEPILLQTEAKEEQARIATPSAELSAPSVEDLASPWEQAEVPSEEAALANRRQSLSLYPVFTLTPIQPQLELDAPETTARNSTDLEQQAVVESPVRTQEASETAPPASTLDCFAPLTEIEANIPSFERFLPSSYRKVGQTTAPIPPSEKSDAEPVAPPVFHTAAPAVDVEALSVREQPLVQSAAPHTSEATPYSTARPRRSSRTRSRHARNVRPNQTPSGLQSPELRTNLPAHIQALLALERLGEEAEVAQFSYKRPFQEKRRELIERLLDPILTLEEAARLLNVCPTTVRRYTNKGILTYYRKEPDRSSKAGVNPNKETRQRRFRLSDILAFLETQQAAIQADRRQENTRSRRAPDPSEGQAPISGPADEAVRPNSQSED